MKRRSKAFVAELLKLKDHSKQLSRVATTGRLMLNDEVLFGWLSRVQNFELVVLGKYNSGKTTLLNLLLSLANEDSLPTGIRPTTNKLWKIRYTSRPQLKGMRVGEDKPAFILVKNLPTMLAKLESDSLAAVIQSIDYYELGLPVPWLKRTGWAIWDTPGKDDVQGLLDEKIFKDVLKHAEGALLVTNYDGYRNTRDYLEQINASELDCLAVALTNSGPRSFEQFLNGSSTHLGHIREYLQDLFPAFVSMFSIDSKQVAKDTFSEQHLEGDEAITNRNQSCSNSLRSGNSSDHTWESILQTSAAPGNQGLIQLLKAIQEIEEIEEDLMLTKAWRSLWMIVCQLLLQIGNRIDELESKEKLLFEEMGQIDRKIGLSIDASDSTTLWNFIIESIENKLESKARRSRSKIEGILEESIRKNSPGTGTKILRGLTFGGLGGNEKKDHETFVVDFLGKVWSYSEDFVSKTLWELISKEAIGRADYLARKSAGNFRAEVEAKQGWNYKFRLENPSQEDLGRFTWESFNKLREMVEQPGFESSADAQKRFLDEVESQSQIVSHKMVGHAVWWLGEQMQEKLERFRENALQYLRNEKSLKNKVLGRFQIDIQKAIETRSGLSDLLSQSQSAVQSHLKIISNQTP